jgi:hypothetical protein
MEENGCSPCTDGRVISGKGQDYSAGEEQSFQMMLGKLGIYVKRTIFIPYLPEAYTKTNFRWTKDLSI